MLTRHPRALLGRTDRGLYFPINHRIVDQRVQTDVAEQADVQGRYRRHLRTSFMTREVRQTEVPTWSRQVRPTHFLSLRLPERNGLTGRVREVRDAILFAHQGMESLFVPLPKLHLTLGVLTLPETNRDQALQAVRDCVEEVCCAECKQPLRLSFRGLGTFSFGRVLFAQCTAEGHFTSLDNAVRRIRKDLGGGLGIDVKGNPYDSYVPHVTIAKIRARQREEFGQRIPIEVWAPYQHHDFGAVTFSQLDLCDMKGQGENGYYKVESTVRLAIA